MTGFVGRLRATLGLDSAEFSNKLRGARQEAQGFSVSVARGLRDLAGPALGLTAFAGTLAAGAMQVRDVMRDIATIGDEAQRAGLSAEAFQEWSHVAAQARIPVDALTDGFKELALRADEFVVTGGGSAAEAFNRLGFSAEDLTRRLRNPSDLFTEIVRRLERFDSGSRIRIADEIFGGTGGERFVALISRGADALDDTRQRARDLGLVLDDSVVRRAADIDARFTELQASFGAFFRSVVVDAAEFAMQVGNISDEIEGIQGLRNQAQGGALLGEGAANQLNENADAARENASAVAELLVEYERLQGEATALAPAIQRLSDELSDAGEDQAATAVSALALGIQRLGAQLDAGEISAADYEGQMRDLITSAVEALDSVEDLDTPTFERVLARLGALGTMLSMLTTRAGELRQSLPGNTPVRQAESFWDTEEGRFSTLGRLAPTTSPTPGRAPHNIDFDLPSTDTGAGGGSGGGSSETYATMLADIRQRTEALKAEAEALADVAASGVDYGDAAEYARTRAELLAQAQAEGRALTPELRAEIDAAAAAYVTQTEAVDDLTAALERQRAAGERGAQAVTDILMAAGESAEAGRNAVARLIMEIARMQMMRGFQTLAGTSLGGGFFSFIGNLIGKNARGTESWRGGLTVVGEEGPELVNLPTGTRITPALATAERLRNGLGANGTAASGRIEVALSPELIAQVLDQAAQQSLHISQATTAASARTMDGGMFGRVRSMDERGR